MSATLYQPHRHQQAPNKQALSKPITIALYTWPYSHWQLLGSPLHQEPAPLHKDKNQKWQHYWKPWANQTASSIFHLEKLYNMSLGISVFFATLPSPSEMAKEAGYNTSRTASHRDLSWRRFSSTPTSLPANHRLQKVCLCWRCSNHACWWRLAGNGRGADQGHGNSKLIPQTWKLKLSTAKTMSAAFHLNNKEAKRELKVKYNNEILPFCSEPKYLGVMLDRSLTYCLHLESLRKKLTSRSWGGLLARAGVLEQQLLQIATLALVHITAEYFVPVWCRSSYKRLADPAINDALHIVTGCLHLTPAGNLPILAGIQPTGLRCNGATLSLACRAIEPGHLFHSVAHLAWKKGVCHGRAAFHITFQHKTTLSLKTRKRWILRCCQSIISEKFRRYTACQQYLLIQAVTLVLCTECSETEVATSSLN